MHLIGITGGVGAGKSTVLDYLQEKYKARIIRADDIGRDLIQANGACYQEVLSLFGREILGRDLEIDRAKLAAIVYDRPALLEKLNKIIHPRVKERILKEIEEAKAKKEAFVFLEAALLIEGGYHLICQELWYIYASAERRIDRLMKNRSYSRQKCLKIMENQNREETFRKYCAFEVNNEQSVEDMQKQIDQRMKKYEVM